VPGDRIPLYRFRTRRPVTSQTAMRAGPAVGMETHTDVPPAAIGFGKAESCSLGRAAATRVLVLLVGSHWPSNTRKAESCPHPSSSTTKTREPDTATPETKRSVSM